MKRAGFIWSESCIGLLCFPAPNAFHILRSTNDCEIQRQLAWNEVQLFQTLLQWVQRELLITSLFWILNEFISSRPLWDITMRPGIAFIRFESFNEKRQTLANFCPVCVYKPAKTTLMNQKEKEKKSQTHRQDRQTLALMCKHVLGYHATSNFSDQWLRAWGVSGGVLNGYDALSTFISGSG